MRTDKAFEDQQYRDAFKNKRCRELGIVLINVPYTVGEDELDAYIRRRVRENELYMYLVD